MKRNILVITVLGLLLCVVGAVMTMVQLAETDYVSEKEYRQALGYETLEETFTIDPAKGPVTISDRLMELSYLTVDNRLKDNEIYVNVCYRSGKDGRPVFEVSGDNQLDLIHHGRLSITDDTSYQEIKDLLLKMGRLYKDKRIIGPVNEGIHVVVNQKNFDRINEAYYEAYEADDIDAVEAVEDDEANDAVINA